MTKAPKPKAKFSWQKGKAAAGRPAKVGDRYPSGKLKPVGPNPEVIARRRALTENLMMATCPLDVAFANDWLTQAEYQTGKSYGGVYLRSDICAPGMPRMRDGSIPKGVEDVRDLKWEQLSTAEIARIWDSAFRDLGSLLKPESTGAKDTPAARAWDRWKAINAAMSPEERSEVYAVCVQDSWPQWIIQRRAGHFGTRWERKYDLLVSGLRAMADLMATPTPRAANDHHESEAPARAVSPRVGGQRIERIQYVDEDGNPLLEVERRTRRDAA